MALPYAAGSLYSTVEDLYKWDQALYTDKLVPSDLKQKLFSPNLENYGYGWDIRTIAADEPGAAQTMISHGGGINGFNTLEQRLVSDHDLIVIFNNTPGANLGEMAKGIRAILYGQEPVTPKRSLVLDLGVTLVNRDVDAAVAQYRELKRTNSRGYNFDERALNELGYMLLQRAGIPTPSPSSDSMLRNIPSQATFMTAWPRHMPRTVKNYRPSPTIASHSSPIPKIRMQRTN